MDKLPQLESCCCGCSLRKGTKIIGWLGLIGSIVLIADSISSLLSATARGHKTTDKITIEILFVVKVVMWVVLVIWFLSGVINFILLLGVRMEKPKLVRAYCIICLIIIIFTICVSSYVFGYWAVVGKGPFENYNFVYGLTISLVFQIYFFLVVNSYYYTMGGEGRNLA